MIKKFQFSFSVLLLVLGTLLPFAAYAESVTWSYVIPHELCRVSSFGTCTSDGEGIWVMGNVSAQVTYSIQVTNAVTGAIIQKGATVPAGTKVKYEFVTHTFSDISWFGSGGWYDSPYGVWVGKESENPVIQQSNYVLGVYVRFSVAPPQKSIAGLPAGCETASDGVSKICTLQSAGTVPAVFNFAATSGAFSGNFLGPDVYRYQPNYQLEPLGATTGMFDGNFPIAQGNYGLTVPARSVNYPLTVEAAANAAPGAPALSSGGACVVGQSNSISMTSSDPDGNQIRYGIDWNADGSVDEWIPPTGFVPSGNQQSASRTYATEGQKTVRVLAEDSGGLASGWTNISFTCAPAPSDDDSDSNQTSCAIGYTLQNNTCVFVGCPSGLHAAGQSCVCNGTNLPPNGSGQCTAQVCPSGFQYDPVQDTCVAVQQCQLPPICSDNTHALDRCTNETINCIAQNGPGWYCDAGTCHRPPLPIASIVAVGSLVRRGETTRVSWTSTNTTSCTVTGNNGDGPWTGTTDSHTTSAIQAQTIYTLRCTGLDGTIITRTATINIIPVESEPRL